jgi:hypothetical protein
MAKKKIKVVYKRLRNARGYFYYPENKIEIDSRLQGEELLSTLIHEFTHYIQPYLDEDKVELIGNEMAKFLIQQGYTKQS